jgi:glycosyltransferase involved in cell wall biosynthesis
VVLNIGLISAEYPPETGWGGIGTYTRALAHGLVGRGHSVHVLTLSLNQCDYQQMDEQVHVYRVATRRWPLPAGVRRQGAGIWALLERSASVARYVSQLHRAVRFDVLEAPNWGAEALVYSLRPTAPLVIRVSTPIAAVAMIAGKAERPRPGLRLHRWLEALPVRRAAGVIAHSRYIAGVVQREYGVPAEQIHVVHLGLDMTACARVAQSVVGPEATLASTLATGVVPNVASVSGHHQRLGRPTVLYVGRLERRKGVRYLLEAIPEVVAAVPDVRFRLVGKDVGDAPSGTSYQAYFASFAPPEARAATSFLGFVDQATLEREYAACDLFVAPSLFESFGLIHLEAMARGKPVVAFCAAATPELVVDGETGLLVPPPAEVGEPQAVAQLAQAIMRLLRAPDEAQRMGQRGRTRALEQFSRDQMVAGTLAVYQTLREPC